MTPAVEAARGWLGRYLAAELDGPELEVVAREDTLFRMVAIVERHERAWLQAQLLDGALPLDQRREVFLSLTGPLRHLVRGAFER